MKLVPLGSDEVHNSVKFVVPASAGPPEGGTTNSHLGGLRSLATLSLLLVSLAAGKVHKTVKFAGGTAKNSKSAKRIVWS